MMNFASYHKKVVIKNFHGNDKVLENVQLIVSGNYLIANGQPTRDEENNEKHVKSLIFDLAELSGYETFTTYYPEEGLENRKQLNG